MTGTKYRITAKLFFLVQIAALCVFWGRAWQHWFWDAPYRSLLWDEVWMSGLVEVLLGMNWEDYVTNNAVDKGIQTWIRITAVIYFLAGAAVLGIKYFGKWARTLIWFGLINLVLLSLLYFKERFFAVGQFFEYALQMLAPFLVLYTDRRSWVTHRFITGLKWAIMLTFTCHGLYAIGYYPRPVHFQEMVMNILHLPENAVKYFLNAAGILDFVMSIMIFLPWKRIQLLGLLYAIAWGFFTSIARVWAFVHVEYFVSSLHQWWYETVFRFPHFLLPLLVLLLLLQKEKSNPTSTEVGVPA